MFYPISPELLGRDLMSREQSPAVEAHAPEQFAKSRRALIWAAMLTGSALPQVVAQFLGYQSGYLLPILQAAALVILAVVADHSKRLRAALGFILTIAVLRLTWSFIAPSLAASAMVAQANHVLSIGGQLFLSRFLLALGMPIMLLAMAGLRISRKTLYLRRGEMSALARPEPILWFRQPVRWTRLGPQLLAVFGGVLAVFLYFTIHPAIGGVGRLLFLLPWALATATLNAASEEFQFRCVPLAQLRGVLPVSEMLWLTALFFGLGHYFGQPSGVAGAVMATIAGWLWGKSIVETGGVAWALIIHTVQDIVIFYFLALSMGN